MKRSHPFLTGWPIATYTSFPQKNHTATNPEPSQLEPSCVFKTIAPPDCLYFYLEPVLPPHPRNQAQFDLLACSVETTLLAVLWYQLPFIEVYAMWKERPPSVLMLLHDGQAECGGAESSISGQTRSLLFTRLPPCWSRVRALLFRLWGSSPRAPVHISLLPRSQSEGSIEICNLPLNCAPAASLAALSEATPELFTRQPPKMDQDFPSVRVGVIAELELRTGLQDTVLQRQTSSGCHSSQHKESCSVGAWAANCFLHIYSPCRLALLPALAREAAPVAGKAWCRDS